MMHTTIDSLPVFQYEIPKDIIDETFSGALELMPFNNFLQQSDDEEIKYDVSNKNIDGSIIETRVHFVSSIRAHHQNEKIKLLSTYVENLANKIALEYYDADINFSVKNCTVLRYKNGDKIGKHNHFPYAFVAAIYLHITEDSSPICLGETLKIQPKPGMCLVFPGILYHKVEETKADRIMITMDLLEKIGED